MRRRRAIALAAVIAPQADDVGPADGMVRSAGTARTRDRVAGGPLDEGQVAAAIDNKVQKSVQVELDKAKQVSMQADDLRLDEE